MRSVCSRGLLAVAGGLFSFALLHAPLGAQETLRGRVADAEDAPVAAAVVLLHAVTDGSGRELGRDTAAADGSFEMSFAFEEGPVYFVATRVNGEIFMGEPFREPPAAGIVLRAGPGVEPLSMDGLGAVPTPGAAPAAPAQGSDGGAIWVAVIAAAVLGLVGLLVSRSRRRAPRARELLLEIARLDEARATAPGGPADQAGAARRAALSARLAEALELDPDADRH